jgi:predicted transcriptional regulator of viral defense system
VTFTGVEGSDSRRAFSFEFGKLWCVPADRSSLRNRLTALGAGQSGYFTASQARQLGYSYSQQNFHTERGNWVRVERGLYRLPHWPLGPHDDLVRASLWSRDRAVVSHESAAFVHGLGEIDPLRTHLTVPAGFRGKHPAVVLHRASIDRAEIQQHAGFRVTTPLRTLVDLARSATDLDQLGRAIRSALERHLLTMRDLRSRSEQLDVRAALNIERALLEDASP